VNEVKASATCEHALEQLTGQKKTVLTNVGAVLVNALPPDAAGYRWVGQQFSLRQVNHTWE
jgi:hypothetical protein